MTINVLLIAMLGLLTSGCYVPQFAKGDGHYQVHVDESFSSDQKMRIRRALSDWEDATDGTVTFEATDLDSSGADFIRIDAATATDLHDLAQGQTGMPKHLLALTSEDGTTADSNLLRNIRGNLFSQTVHHELGHALGLHHQTGHELMYPSSDGATQNITCLDVEQFCSVWGCEAQELSGCREPLAE
jgi:hypothetical protein